MANRRKQIEAIQKKAAALAEEVDLLIDELEEALENMPDNIRDGQRGDIAQERIDLLQALSDALTEMADEPL